MTQQARWMRRCLELAARAEGRCSPNPMVGCVIVDAKGKLVSEGYHRRAGGPHAEVVALKKAGTRARGATMYVSLEPCNHQGRTPPCAPQVVAAGIAKVVYAAAETTAGHGGGADFLHGQGVRVRGGLLEDEAREQNRGFFSVVERSRPFVTVKAAVSADGKVATRGGQSQWITGEAARADGHHLRDRLDAIMVGLGTARADDPRLTARGRKSARDPVRVLVDSRLRISSKAKLLPENSESRARCIIACTQEASQAPERRLSRLGAEVWRLPKTRAGQVRLPALFKRLASDGMLTVLVEGGPALVGSAMDADLVDEVRLYMAPQVFGGPAPSWVAGRGAKSLDMVRKFRYFGAVDRLGEDLAVTLRRH